MEVIIFIFALAFCYGIIKMSINFIRWISNGFNKKQIDSKPNPYIQMHEIKDLNDTNYDDYLKWLDKKGHGVPIPKINTPEDKVAEKKINRWL